MANLVIQDAKLAERLQRLARKQNQSVEQMLNTLLDKSYPVDSTEEDAEFQPGSSDWIVAHLDEWAFTTENPIPSEQISEILRNEFADYLLSRMNRSDDTATDTP